MTPSGPEKHVQVAIYLFFLLKQTRWNPHIQSP